MSWSYTTIHDLTLTFPDSAFHKNAKFKKQHLSLSWHLSTMYVMIPNQNHKIQSGYVTVLHYSGHNNPISTVGMIRKHSVSHCTYQRSISWFCTIHNDNYRKFCSYRSLLPFVKKWITWPTNLVRHGIRFKLNFISQTFVLRQYVTVLGQVYPINMSNIVCCSPSLCMSQYITSKSALPAHYYHLSRRG